MPETIITISDQKKIFQIQKEFNDAYPYLQIQFFTKSVKTGSLNVKSKTIDSQKSIGESRTIHNRRTLEIISTQTVKDLEQNFQTVFGLSVQVFRKSGKIWLETNVTDNWTLEEQNKEGKALSRVIKKDKT